MTTHDAGPPAQTDAKRLRFDRYVLDLHSGRLLRDGNEIELRPKTFAVLTYLVQNVGRLVSKDDLFAAVWPNLAITDDVLVQSTEMTGERVFQEVVDPAGIERLEDPLRARLLAALRGDGEGAPRT